MDPKMFPEEAGLLSVVVVIGLKVLLITGGFVFVLSEVFVKGFVTPAISVVPPN
jgi:hypothetical protein